MTARTNGAGVACCGSFVPFDPTRTGKRSARVGWITDRNGCDIWQGCNVGGYGRVEIRGRMYMVYRIRYEREIGPIPEGMKLDHYICDNGPGGCCNPHHCRPVTHRENSLRSDTITALNRAKTHCKRGHLLVGHNLLKTGIARGGRWCRKCHVARGSAAKKARRARGRVAA